MLRVYQIARAISGRQELNTLDIKAYWELIEISAPEGDPEPEEHGLMTEPLKRKMIGNWSKSLFPRASLNPTSEMKRACHP